MLAYPADIILSYLSKRTLRGVRRAAQGTAHVVSALSKHVHDIRCSTAVDAVRLGGGSIGNSQPALRLQGSSEWLSFDAIIMATPPAVSAALLRPTGPASSTDASFSRVLEGFKSEGSQLVLHCDPSCMPAEKSLWSSVNFALVSPSSTQAPAAASASGPAAASVVYNAQACIWLNAAQQNSAPSMPQRQLFQTWNPVKPIAPEHILTSSEFQRPLCSISSVQLLKQLWTLQGQGGVFVCGSYCTHSMPLLESAVTSALEIVGGRLGAVLPWDYDRPCLYKDIDFKLKNCKLDFQLVSGRVVAAGTASAALLLAAAVYFKMRR